jgi:protein ImuB
MRRVVSIWFPTFPTDRIRQQSVAPPESAEPLTETAPLVTVARDGNRRVLAAVDAVASGLGLRAGMKLAQAQALVPNLAIHEHDPDGDAAALRRLAGWCLRYAPLAAIDPPDGLWIDVTGSTHLHGGETRLLHDLVRRLTRSGPANPGPANQGTANPSAAKQGPPGRGTPRPGQPDQHLAQFGQPNQHGLPYRGLTTRAAVAHTPAVAHAMARFGGQMVTVVPPDAAILNDLPIEALRLPPEVAGSLRLMGFDRIGPLAAAARAPLVRRFGTILADRLDQATGKLFEPIEPIVPPGLIQARLCFVEPLLTAEAFATVIARLTAMVCAEMEQAGSGARRLDLLFERVDATVQAVRVGSVRPVRDPRHWGRMLEERLERIDPGLGVEAMRLIASATDPVRFTQISAHLAAPQTPVSPGFPAARLPDTPPTAAAISQIDIAPLVDRLINRLGETQVYRIAPTQSDVPERSVRRVPALSAAPLSAAGGPGWPADLPRPVRLLDPPQPVDAMALLPDHPPVAFTWRRVRHRVRRADGPERIAGEWWKRDGEMRSVRDYFRVEDEDGRRFWLFRRGDGSDRETGDMRWFLHGFF